MTEGLKWKGFGVGRAVQKYKQLFVYRSILFGWRDFSECFHAIKALF